MPEDRSNNLTNITKPKRRISEPFIITTCTKTEAEPRTLHPLSKPLSNSPHLRESQFRNPEKFGRIKSLFSPPLPPTPLYCPFLLSLSLREQTLFSGLPRCKNLWTFSLFYTFCFSGFCCVYFFVFFVYVTREYNRFLHRGWALFSAGQTRAEKSVWLRGLTLSTLKETSFFTNTVFVITMSELKAGDLLFYERMRF